MSLDDRSLREHLDRRAEEGVSDVEQIAEVVMTRVAEIDRGTWWRRVAMRGPSMGLAAALVAVVVAVAVLPPRIWPGPGSSASPSGPTGPASLTGYPGDRPLTLDELVQILSGDAAEVIGRTLVADVELVPTLVSCVSQMVCPSHQILLPGGDVLATVWVDTRDGPVLDGPYAFRVKTAQLLDLVASVRPAAGALAWTLSEYLAELPGFFETDRGTSDAYLVEADAVRLAGPPPCPPAERDPKPLIDFACGQAAFLVPPGAPMPASTVSDDTLRIQNQPPVDWPDGGLRASSFFLVRPLGVDTCFMCVPGATSQLLAKVDSIDVPVMSSPSTAPATTEPAPSQPTPAADATGLPVEEITFSMDWVTLNGFETADLTVTIAFAGDVVPYHGADASLTPLLYLQRDAGDTGDPLDPHIAQLVRTMTESPAAGRWTATFRLTSGDRGIWHVDGLTAYNADGHELNIGPAIRDASPKLEVIGTSAPHLTMEVTPSPFEIGQALEVSGKVTDEDTGDPLRDVVVTIGQGDVCNLGGTGTTVTTNPNGAYTYVIPAVGHATVCAWISDEPGVHPSIDSDVPIALYGILFADTTALP